MTNVLGEISKRLQQLFKNFLIDVVVHRHEDDPILEFFGPNINLGLLAVTSARCALRKIVHSNTTGFPSTPFQCTILWKWCDTIKFVFTKRH